MHSCMHLSVSIDISRQGEVLTSVMAPYKKPSCRYGEVFYLCLVAFSYQAG